VKRNLHHPLAERLDPPYRTFLPAVAGERSPPPAFVTRRHFFYPNKVPIVPQTQLGAAKRRALQNLFAILEDNSDRIAEMRACAQEALPNLRPVFFVNAHEMIAWLELNLPQIALISLDHDLPVMSVEGRLVDCGDGRLVANALGKVAPTCPVIIHSSNDHCATTMFHTLRDAGWPTTEIVPFDGHAWVRAVWMPHLLQLVRDGRIMA
jgi:hypothetical protein